MIHFLGWTDCCISLQDNTLHLESDRAGYRDLDYKGNADISLNVSLSPPGVFRSGNILCSFIPHTFVFLKQSILPALFSLFRCLFLSFKFCVFFTSQGTREKIDEKRDLKSKGGWKRLKENADWNVNVITVEEAHKRDKQKAVVLKPNDISIWPCKTDSVWSCSFLGHRLHLSRIKKDFQFESQLLSN